MGLSGLGQRPYESRVSAVLVEFLRSHNGKEMCTLKYCGELVTGFPDYKLEVGRQAAMAECLIRHANTSPMAWLTT